MAEQFQKNRTVIGRHINNVYKEGELDRTTTCAKFAHMGMEGDQQYETTVYNLDVIISVGYRVKSQRGTQFRIWANKVLKAYLLQGYAVSEHIRRDNFNELRQLVQVLGRTVREQEALTTDESRSLLEVVVDYTYALKIKENGDRTLLIFLPGYD